jgi:hypothetical protein
MKIAGITLFLFAINFCLGGLHAQVVGDKIYYTYDPKLVRGTIGYTQMSLDMRTDDPKLTIPARGAGALYLRAEGRILSGFMKAKNRIVLRDAFYLDMIMGKLTVPPLPFGAIGNESKFCTGGSFGYQFLLGYRTEQWAALGGIDFTLANVSLGSAFDPQNLFTYYHPWMARGEYKIGKDTGEEFRIITSVWSNFSKDKSFSGAFVDFPVAKQKRYWITFQYQSRKTGNMTVVSYNSYPSTLTQWMIGFKVGSIY